MLVPAASLACNVFLLNQHRGGHHQAHMCGAPARRPPAACLPAPLSRCCVWALEASASSARMPWPASSPSCPLPLTLPPPEAESCCACSSCCSPSAAVPPDVWLPAGAAGAAEGRTQQSQKQQQARGHWQHCHSYCWRNTGAALASETQSSIVAKCAVSSVAERHSAARCMRNTTCAYAVHRSQ